MGETTRQVGRAMVWSVAARAARFALGLASSIIIVRALGKHDYGVLSLLRVMLVFAGIVAGAGMGQSLLKFLPVLRVGGDRAGALNVVRRVILVQFVAWSVLLALSYLLAGWFENEFSFEGIGKVLWIAVGLEVFEITFGVVSQILNAYYDTKLLSVANVVGHVVYIVFLLVLLPAGYGVVGVVAATAAGNLVATLVVTRNVLAQLQVGSEQPAGEKIGWGRLLRFSLPFALIGLLNVIVWRQSETIFLARFRSAAETGFFDLAYRFPQTVLEFVPLTVWPIIMAGVSEAYAKDPSRLNAAIDRYYRMLFLICAPICLTGLALGGRMIPILYGEPMAPAAIPTQLFFVIFPMSFFGTPLSMALYVIEKSHVNLLICVVLAIVNVGLDLLLIPRYGVIGAMIPVGLVIAGSPFLYRYGLARYVSGIRVPFGFIGKCFLASSPVLIMLPLAGLIRGTFELCVALCVSCVLILATAKRIKLLGKEELDMLASVPIPAAHRLLRLIS
jgi:O-antigen/teichoic acid export membrane protein